MTAPHGSSSVAHVRWERFLDDAPELARRVRDRFAANLHHVIGTVRPSGAPRLSGTEVRIEPTGVTIGMMAGSRKLADVRRDPRVELHSAPLEDELRTGDARLIGRLIERDDLLPDHPGAGHFDLLVDRVVLTRVEDGHLVVTSWDPELGLREQRRR
jgi:hypothetical protein